MSEESKNQKGEANFNDSELQDIMAEIESLEQDFSSNEAEVEQEMTAEVVAEEELSSGSEQEVVAEVVVEESFEEEPEASFSESEDVLESELSAEEECSVSEITPISKSTSESPMEFHGAGVLDFNMSFPVGEQKANVKVEDGQVKVVLGDVSFSISEEGCFVEMAGGVQFSVPAPGHKSIKKAA